MDNFDLTFTHWLILGGLLIVAELFTTSFFALLFGISAIVIAIVTAMISWILPVHWFIQVLIWLMLSIIMTFVWFKSIYPTIKAKKTALGSDEIIGQTGMIIMPLNPAWQSKVRFSVPMFGADEWVCRVVDNQNVQVGERVKVIDIMGNELLVVPTATI